MKTFEIGKTYYTRSICDYDCIIKVTVASRTAKTIKTTDGKSFRIAVWSDVEQIKPWGRGSMMPIIDATKIAHAA